MLAARRGPGKSVDAAPSARDPFPMTRFAFFALTSAAADAPKAAVTAPTRATAAFDGVRS